VAGAATLVSGAAAVAHILVTDMTIVQRVLAVLLAVWVIAALPAWSLVFIGALFGGQYFEGVRVLIVLALVVLIPLGPPLQVIVAWRAWRGRSSLLVAAGLTGALGLYAVSFLWYSLQMIGLDRTIADELRYWTFAPPVVPDPLLPRFLIVPSLSSAAVVLGMLNLLLQFLLRWSSARHQLRRTASDQSFSHQRERDGPSGCSRTR
jgi:hypothetical protein